MACGSTAAPRSVNSSSRDKLPSPPGATQVVANGRTVDWPEPGTLEAFLIAQDLLPRSVVVELNGEAVPPSDFPGRQVRAGDRMEIIRIVAGG